jgi:hypothetical protein
MSIVVFATQLRSGPGFWWQPTATVLTDFAVFGRERFATGCHRLQPRGSILRCHF